MIPFAVFFSSILLSALPEDSEEDDRRWAVDFVRGRALRWGPEFARRMADPFPDPDLILEELWDRERLEAERDPDLNHDWTCAYDLLGGKDEELFRRLVSDYPSVGSQGLRKLVTYGGCRCGPGCSCSETSGRPLSRYGETHTQASSLVAVPTPYPTRVPVLLHPAAAASFARVLATRGLTEEDLRSLCRVNSSFRSWDQQLQLIERYKRAVGSEEWISWKALTEAQKNAARRAGFAYHPAPPSDRPHTHVGGGALDIDDALTSRAVDALHAEGWKMDAPGDVVHWGWHGDLSAVPADPEEGFLESWLSWLWPSSSPTTDLGPTTRGVRGGLVPNQPPTTGLPSATVEAAPGATVELTAADGTVFSTGLVPAGTYDAVISGKQKRVTLEAGRTYRASSIGTLYG